MITEKRLIQLGFNPKYLPTDWENNRIVNQFEYDKGSILIGREGNEFYVKIYASITSDIDYATKAHGVKTESDLLKLCELVDG